MMDGMLKMLLSRDTAVNVREIAVRKLRLEANFTGVMTPSAQESFSDKLQVSYGAAGVSARL